MIKKFFKIIVHNFTQLQMQILVRYDEVMHCIFLRYIHNSWLENERAPVTISEKQENREFARSREYFDVFLSRFTQRNPNSEWPEVEIKMQGENNVNCQFRATPSLLLSFTPGQVISISRPSTKRNANKLFTRRRSSGPTLSSPVIHPAHNCTYKNAII